MKRFILLFVFFPFCVLAQKNPYVFMRDLYTGYESYSGSVVLVSQAPLYTAPDTNSKVLKTLSFKTPVTVTESGNDETSKLQWYKVKLEGMEGFLLSWQVAQNSFFNSAKNIRYFTHDPSPHIMDDSLNLLRYDETLGKFTDTLGVTGLSSEGFYTVKMQETALKFANVLLKVEITLPYCGGGQRTLYFADTPNGLLFMLAAFSGGDIGYSESASVWLPVKNTKGKTMLTMDGTLPGAGDPKNNTLVFAVPGHIKVAKEELVVVKYLDEETELDENSDPVKNEDGSEKVNITRDTTVYYRWNGRELTEVKKAQNH